MQVGLRAFEIAIQRFHPLVELRRRRIGKRLDMCRWILGGERFAKLRLSFTELKETQTAIGCANHDQTEGSSCGSICDVDALPACAVNRVALAIPCHRVIRSGGELGGYRWGLERKRTLIDHERRSQARSR
jgi:hypothetical protein